MDKVGCQQLKAVKKLICIDLPNKDATSVVLREETYRRLPRRLLKMAEVFLHPVCLNPAPKP